MDENGKERGGTTEGVISFRVGQAGVLHSVGRELREDDGGATTLFDIQGPSPLPPALSRAVSGAPPRAGRTFQHAECARSEEYGCECATPLQADQGCGADEAPSLGRGGGGSKFELHAPREPRKPMSSDPPFRTTVSPHLLKRSCSGQRRWPGKSMMCYTVLLVPLMQNYFRRVDLRSVHQAAHASLVHRICVLGGAKSLFQKPTAFINVDHVSELVALHIKTRPASFPFQRTTSFIPVRESMGKNLLLDPWALNHGFVGCVA
jgi:hypothetical protein